MIPHKILLPQLSPKDQAEFSKLCAEYERLHAVIAAHNRDACTARKRALRIEMSSARSEKLLSIGAELETLERSFAQARSGAKAQLRALGGRYVTLFKRLLPDCEKHADALSDRATVEWAKHFSAFEAAPSGTSPLVLFIQTWRQNLNQKREHLQSIALGMTPPAPTSLLPYPAKR